MHTDRALTVSAVLLDLADLVDNYRSATPRNLCTPSQLDWIVRQARAYAGQATVRPVEMREERGAVSGTDELRAGMRVLVRGSFGYGDATPRIIKRIELVDPGHGGKEGGRQVDVVTWAHMRDIREIDAPTVVMDFEDGTWAYGHQIDPCPHERL